MRVLILAPVGRDATLLASTIRALQIEAAIAENPNALLEMLAEGVGCALVAEEALRRESIDALAAWLSVQASWSDTPFILLTSAGRPSRESERRARELEALANFTLIERPARPETIQSAVRAALRARMRQYEIRSQQEALMQANADLEQFAHSASHDLREPIRSVGIYSGLLAKECGERLGSRGMARLDIIRSAARQMDALLTDLRAYAQVSGIADAPVEPVASAGPLMQAQANLAGAMEESHAQITVRDMPVVRMRASHLTQVFQNLIGNAIKYRAENVRLVIEISARMADGQAIFSVADNGIGIPPEYKETIFGIFKRLHTVEQYSGTGMGLAICQRIVERYHGRIWVESEPGRGSTFFFTVPV